MKKYLKRIIAVLFLLFSLPLTACSFFGTGDTGIQFSELREAYYLYTGDYSDLSGEIFAFINGKYGQYANGISIGTTEESDKVYTAANKVSVSRLTYWDGNLVWTEYGNNIASLKVLDIENNNIATLDTFDYEMINPFYMGVYNGIVYYLTIDAEYAKIRSVSVGGGEIDEFYSAEMPGGDNLAMDFPIYNLAIDQNYLTYVTQENNVLFINTTDLITSETNRQELPAEVAITFNVVYSGEAESYFIYYADSQRSEYLSVFKNNELTEIEKLPANYYLYHDILNLNGEYLCYNIQKNVSGNIKDHYSGYIYNISTGKKTTQPKYSFFTAVYNQNSYNICFSSNGTDPVYLNVNPV